MQRRQSLQSTILSFLFTLGAGACGSVEDPVDEPPNDHTSDVDAGPPVEEDDHPPTILDIVPEPGSSITEDNVLVITFSEPMDRDAVEQAIVLPAAAEPTFSWNADGNALYVSKWFRYPQSANPSAKVIEVVVGTDATDRAGDPLASALELEYTPRYGRQEAVLPFSQTLSGNCNSTGCGTYTFLQVGESSSDPTVTVRGFLTFPFDLPDGILIDRAVLESEIELLAGSPFAELGSLWVEDIQFSSIDLSSFNIAGAPLGVLMPSESAPTIGTQGSLDVTSAFRSDYQYRAQRGFKTQFRIRFPFDDPDEPEFAAHHADGEQDVVRLLRPNTSVSVTYLVE